MNILYIAYSCNPNKGSEDKIGWNTPFESAKINKVFVITKEEHREVIEKYVDEHKIENLKFYYVDIPKIYKKCFNGFLYSGRLNIWHHRVLPVAEKICKSEKIDVIHQITPVEFRSIGDYGNISDVKFICGPLGGAESLPEGLRFYAKGNRSVEVFRSVVNFWYRLKYQINKKFKKCDYIFFANRETKSYLEKSIKGITSEIYTDIGLSESEFDDSNRYINNLDLKKRVKSHNKCVFLLAGRMIYRKGHHFLIDVLKRLPSQLEYEFRFVGDGKELESLKKRCKDLNLSDKVFFTGKISFDNMRKEYENADVFVLPSIRETTGSVVLEALSKGLPVITINKFGGSIMVDETTGWLYDGSTKEEYIENLKNILVECIKNPDEIIVRGKNARIRAEKYMWKEKLAHYNDIYRDLIKKVETEKL